MQWNTQGGGEGLWIKNKQICPTSGQNNFEGWTSCWSEKWRLQEKGLELILWNDGKGNSDQVLSWLLFSHLCYFLLL